MLCEKGLNAFAKSINPCHPMHSTAQNVLYLSKLKVFAEDMINVTEKLKFIMGKVENIVVKKEQILVKSTFYFFCLSQGHLSLYQMTKFWT